MLTHLQRVNNELAKVTDDNRSLANELRTRIKELERTNGRGGHPSDANIRRTQTASVKNRFIEAIQRYSQTEAAHRQASKSRLAKQYLVINPTASEGDIKRVVEDPEACEAMFRQAVRPTQTKATRGSADNTTGSVIRSARRGPVYAQRGSGSTRRHPEDRKYHGRVGSAVLGYGSGS
jgi:t-SNARE complex subunit (syntaxin)